MKAQGGKSKKGKVKTRNFKMSPLALYIIQVINLASMSAGEKHNLKVGGGGKVTECTINTPDFIPTG